MFMFHPTLMRWTDLTPSIFGVPPSVRASYGFAAAGTKLYVFGGNTCNFGRSVRRKCSQM